MGHSFHCSVDPHYLHCGVFCDDLPQPRIVLECSASRRIGSAPSHRNDNADSNGSHVDSESYSRVNPQQHTSSDIYAVLHRYPILACPSNQNSKTHQYTQSTVIHPELACNWAGIGGTVVDANNSPVIGTVVVLRGTLNGDTIEQQTVTGINKEYGQSGFEFVLGTAPVNSRNTLYVQLVDLQNIPLSDKVFITTSSDCSKNLVIVRFKKNR